MRLDLHRIAKIASKFHGSQLAKFLQQLVDLRKPHAGKIPDWKWVSAEDLLLDERVNSHLWKGADLKVKPEDKELADRILNTGMFRKKKDCFKNAALIALTFPDAEYVEGYALSSIAPIPIHHAWIRLPGGSILDTTWDTPGTEYIGLIVPDEEVNLWVGSTVGALDYKKLPRLMKSPPSWIYK